LSVTGVVAALEFEARCLGSLSDGSLISISGIGGEHAARAARALVAAGAGALLSWGVAGALDPDLGCGTAVLPGEVVRQADVPGSSTLRRFETCHSWRERLLAGLQGHARVVTAALLSSAAPVATAALKASLFHDTRAVAVDMESAAVAAVAADHGLPFIALRVILDTARDDLPESIMRAFDPGKERRQGLRRAWPLLRPLLYAPADLRPLLRLARQYRLARRTLSECARFGDPTRLADDAGGH
jgi:adenosylhomocysteine nucleosidase